MSNNDQQYVDFLFNNILVQQLRYEHFNTIKQHPNSVWNRSKDEKVVLDIMTQKYKDFYSSKADQIIIKLNEIKEANISSYLTYNRDYYVNQHKSLTDEVKKYKEELYNKPITIKHSIISENIDKLFPGFITDPTLLDKAVTK